jgi:SAM-dependent methyltransferase
MDKILKQTWWDNNLPDQRMFNTFLGWIGGTDAASKVKFRSFLKDKDYKSIIDIGCGPATEYEGFKKDSIDIQYTGVDSSEFLCNYNSNRGVPMIKAEAHSIPVEDSAFDVAHSRHVLEHQPDFRPVLDEIVRVASKLAVHIWFHKPEDKEIIDHDSSTNLYHNFYKKEDIENYLAQNKKVQKVEWLNVDEKENILLIWLN